MAGVQHNDHHHPACALYGVQDCVPLYLGFRMGSEHRACDAGTVHELGYAGVKGPESRADAARTRSRGTQKH